MPPIHMERAESAIRTVIAFTEAFNHHDIIAMLNLFSDDCIYEASSPAPDGMVHKGKTAITHYWQEYFTRSSQAHLKIEQTLGFGLRCIVLWCCDWVDPSGSTSHLRGIDIFLVQNNLITEHQSYTKRN